MREWYRGCGFCAPKKNGRYAEVEVPMKVVSLNIPLIYQNGLKKLVDMGLFTTMTDVIRTCIDKFLKKEINFKHNMDQVTPKREHELMTINMPIEDIKTIAEVFVSNFIGSKPQYPSRSELVRVAIRDFLKEIYEAELAAPEGSTEPDPNIFVDNKGKQWYIEEPIENV